MKTKTTNAGRTAAELAERVRVELSRLEEALSNGEADSLIWAESLVALNSAGNRLSKVADRLSKCGAAPEEEGPGLFGGDGKGSNGRSRK